MMAPNAAPPAITLHRGISLSTDHGEIAELAAPAPYRAALGLVGLERRSTIGAAHRRTRSSVVGRLRALPKLHARSVPAVDHQVGARRVERFASPFAALHQMRYTPKRQSRLVIQPRQKCDQ